MEELIDSKSHTGKLSNFTLGIKKGIPIAIGYVPIAITFGLVSKSSGIPSTISIAMSIFIFAGASQFIGVNLISAGASGAEIVLTTLILNFRHFLMSSSLSQKIEDKISKKFLSIISFGITDETFAVASMIDGQDVSPWLLLGINLIAYISWVTGTILGIFLGNALPSSLRLSMGIALYSMFVGLLVPALTNSKPAVVVALIAILVNCAIKWIPLLSFISTGWGVILSTIIAALAGALLYPVNNN